MIATLLVATSSSAIAQDKGAVEVEVFAKRYLTNNKSNTSDGNLLGGSLGYYMTENVEFIFSYGTYHGIRSSTDYADTARHYCGRPNMAYISNCQSSDNQKIMGYLTSFGASYNFDRSDIALHPFVSVGVAHQSIGQAERNGRNHSTFANVGVGLKYDITKDVFAKASVDGMHSIDANENELMTGLSLGMKFGQ